jgi:hypothetical protein
LKLLLDEMYSEKIAEQLRARGHDVVCVTEREDLRSVEDEALLLHMVQERRVIVSDNWRDFGPILTKMGVEETPHYGVIFTSGRRLPRSKESIGLYVHVLEEFLIAHPLEDALLNISVWVPGA